MKKKAIMHVFILLWSKRRKMHKALNEWTWIHS